MNLVKNIMCLFEFDNNKIHEVFIFFYNALSTVEVHDLVQVPFCKNKKRLVLRESYRECIDGFWFKFPTYIITI